MIFNFLGGQAEPATSAPATTTLPEAELKAILDHLPTNFAQQQQQQQQATVAASMLQQPHQGGEIVPPFATSVVGNPATLLQQQQQQQIENQNSLPKEFAQLLANAGADNLLKSLENPDPRSLQQQQPQQQQIYNPNNILQSNLQGFDAQALTRQLYNNNAFVSNPSAYPNLHTNPAVEYIARALASTRYPEKRQSVLSYHRNIAKAVKSEGFLNELQGLLHKYGQGVDGQKKHIVTNGPIEGEEGAQHQLKGNRYKIKLLNRKRSSIGTKKSSSSSSGSKKKTSKLTKRQKLSPYYNTTETTHNERGSKRDMPNW